MVKTTEGYGPLNDDGKIYVAKGSKICETRFDDKKGNDFEVKVSATLAHHEPRDVNWIEISVTKFGEKRNKFSSFCLHDLEQIRRLRDVCNLALGEES